MSHDRRTPATPALVLRVVAGCLLLGLIATRVDPGQLTIAWSTRTLGGLAAAVALLGVAQILSALRWSLVLGDPAVSFGALLRLNLVGGFFSLFLPTSVGGTPSGPWASPGPRAIPCGRSPA